MISEKAWNYAQVFLDGDVITKEKKHLVAANVQQILDDEKSRELRCEKCIFFNSKGLLGGECRVAPPMKSVLGDWITYPKVRRDHPQCKKAQPVESLHKDKGCYVGRQLW